MPVIRIATRQSPLALWQANHVRARLLAQDPSLEVVLLPMVTRGDQWLETSLARLGGKNLFVKELETALLSGDADIAVHSMKDVAAELPDGLMIDTVLEREDPSDALVGADAHSLENLPEGARVGTCSLRRRSQLLAHRPDLDIGLLRGNVNTRLAKLDAGEHDAIVLAAAGLMRLEFEDRIAARLPRSICLPAIGQGIVGIECRSDDARVRHVLSGLHHEPTSIRLAAERALSRHLAGGCSSPIAGHATLLGNRLTLEGRVAALDGCEMLIETGSITLPVDPLEACLHAAGLGVSVGKALFAAGAARLLQMAADSIEPVADAGAQA